MISHLPGGTMRIKLIAIIADDTGRFLPPMLEVHADRVPYVPLHPYGCKYRRRRIPHAGDHRHAMVRLIVRLAA